MASRAINFESERAHTFDVDFALLSNGAFLNGLGFPQHLSVTVNFERQQCGNYWTAANVRDADDRLERTEVSCHRVRDVRYSIGLAVRGQRVFGRFALEDHFFIVVTLRSMFPQLPVSNDRLYLSSVVQIK